MTVCVLGRDKRDAGHPACRSCQAQGVTCPFPCLTGDTPLKSEISSPDQTDVPAKAKKEPNKTESAYRWRLVLEYPDPEVLIIFEPITFHLLNGHSYTPDWGVFFPDGTVLFVEVKGVGKNGFKHGSYQRAKCMYDQCRVEYEKFPFFKWRWAEKRGDVWTVTE